LAIADNRGWSSFEQFHQRASNCELQWPFVAYNQWTRFNTVQEYWQVLGTYQIQNNRFRCEPPNFAKIALSALKNRHLEWSNEHLNTRPLTKNTPSSSWNLVKSVVPYCLDTLDLELKFSPSVEPSILQLKILCWFKSLPFNRTFHILTNSGHLTCIQKFVVSPLIAHSPFSPRALAYY